jgi:DNA-binding MarR family transcriptional regulator
MGKTEKLAASVLTESASHLLHRTLQIALDIYAEETGKGALTQRQFAVLAAASGVDGASQTDLVKMTGIDRSTLADMVARMIEKGWIARERSSTDARAKTVRPTPEGLAALKITTPQVEAADIRILAGLPSSKRSAFLAALRSLAGDPVEDGEDGRKKKKKTPKAEKTARGPKSKTKAKGEKDGRRKKKKVKKLQSAERRPTA